MNARHGTRWELSFRLVESENSLFHPSFFAALFLFSPFSDLEMTFESSTLLNRTEQLSTRCRVRRDSVAELKETQKRLR